MFSGIVSPAVINPSTYDLVAASWLLEGSLKLVILNQPAGKLPDIDVEPSCANAPGPI